MHPDSSCSFCCSIRIPCMYVCLHVNVCMCVCSCLHCKHNRKTKQCIYIYIYRLCPYTCLFMCGCLHIYIYIYTYMIVVLFIPHDLGDRAVGELCSSPLSARFALRIATRSSKQSKITPSSHYRHKLARKLEHDRPPSPTQSQAENQHRSSCIRVPSFWSLQ